MIFKRNDCFSGMAFLLLCCLLISGCDKGDGNKDAERDLSIKEGNARATGSACRQAGRALEDCYKLNPESDRASVFAGWKDMNDYMRENKMEEVKPMLDGPVAASAAAESKDKSSSKKSER
ncbi:hypothetical protein AAKU67_002466 [Oxalobacteraceae bacterium GrIS 2.11]